MLGLFFVKLNRHNHYLWLVYEISIFYPHLITMEQFNFVFVRRTYQGKFSIKNLLFNSNLQEFTQYACYIASLEKYGELSPEEAYNKIDAFFDQLQRTSQELGIRENS